MQTSASISGGSSGGGLFDDSGALVGLTTLKVAGDAQNLNFAIPADWIIDLPDRHARLSKKSSATATRTDESASAASSQPGR